MSQPQAPKPAKLVIGILLKDKTLLPRVIQDLEQTYGRVDLVSSWFEFDFTEYYAPEMGKPLFRRLLVFQDLVEQIALAEIKRHTNSIEQTYALEGKRQLNLDPGYLLYERFVLASGKNFTHRVYIGNMIYADLTLIFQKGAFQTLPWTYPDYAEPNLRSFLMQVRKKYAFDLTQSKMES